MVVRSRKMSNATEVALSLVAGTSRPVNRLGRQPSPDAAAAADDDDGHAADEGPTTTTKALMIFVVAPRHFSVGGKPLTKDDEEEKQEQEEEKAKPGLFDAVFRRKDSTASNVAPRIADEKQSEQSLDDTKTRLPVDKKADKAEIDELTEATELEEVTADETQSSAVEDEGKLTAEETRDEDEPTPQEAEAVKKVGDNPDDAEINVEKLARIAFKELLESWHFLNVPTFSLITRYEASALSNLEQPLDDDKSNDPMDKKASWFQIQVMARPTSLGIILDRMERIGVGTNFGTLSVYKAELCRTASPYAHHRPEPPVEEESKDGMADTVATSAPSSVAGTDTGDNNLPQSSSGADLKGMDKEKGMDKAAIKERQIEAARLEWKNAATRLKIEQVREQIEEQSVLAFDFIMLLTVASILAGVGLITDNTVVIVASMLVSPIMGPVLGMTFGGTIRDMPLVISSLRTECLALLGCVIIGAFIGLGAGYTNLAEDTWPTNEMQIRGEPSGLLTGIAIAIPSGMGVCLSILGGNTSSLVGVAISASLLPPAVNAGVCFIYSFLLRFGGADNEAKTSGEFAVIGSISLALTVINIVCIFVSGVAMFLVKEVAPMEEKSAFWARDLHVARELNKMQKGDKPPPVDVEVIREGINALDKEDSARVQFRPPSPTARPKRENSRPTIDSAFAISPAHHHEKKSSMADGLAALFGSIFEKRPTPEELAAQEERYGVKYVGLEDMGTLLGFNEEDDGSFVDPADLARAYGHGRYL